jgi:GNAT superfamily N-acetyltransferase
LKWNGNSTPVEAEEPDDFIYEYDGSIYSLDDDEKETLVGRFRVFYVDLDASGMSVFDTLDARQETFQFLHPLFDQRTGDYKESIFKLAEDLINRNLLILDRVEILPTFRGKKLALIVMRRLIERFTQGSGLVALKAYPLQFEAQNDRDDWRKKMALTSFHSDEKASTTKLKKHYSRLGFLAIRGTPFMVRSTAFQLPSVEDILR